MHKIRAISIQNLPFGRLRPDDAEELEVVVAPIVEVVFVIVELIFV